MDKFVQNCALMRVTVTAVLVYNQPQEMISGNMNSQAYQYKVINNIKMRCECIMFSVKQFDFQQDHVPCNNSMNTRVFMRCQGITVKLASLSPIKTVLNIVKRCTGPLPIRKEALGKMSKKGLDE